MAAPSRHTGDHEFQGTVSFVGEMNVPAGTVDNASVSGTTFLAHTKLTHRVTVHHTQKTTASVVAYSEIGHVCHRPSRIISVRGLLETLPATHRHMVDVLKSSTGGAYATALSTPLILSSTSAARVSQAATLGSTSAVYIAQGGSVKITITTSGTTGTDGKGLGVCVHLAEDGQ